tara:strand:+ start:2601 stop:3761 length:1161 start_codon:yes stop_codon:yes gene_type:complete
MYPTISHLIYDIFGIYIPLPIQTFGFWVAIAFLFASWTLSLELKRKEKTGLLKSTYIKEIIGKKISNIDLALGFIWFFFIGFKLIEAIFNYSDLVANPQEFILSKRGDVTGGFVVAIISTYLKWNKSKEQRLEKPKEVKKEVHPYQLVGNITMIAAVSGIIGAKIFHNLENLDLFIADPIGQLISFSGLTFYGGLIAGAGSVLWYVNKYNIKPLDICDATGPGLMLAYGIGRIGCQMSGDGDWGIDNLSPKPEWMSFLPDWMWSYDFPHNVIRSGIPIENCSNEWIPYCYKLANPVWPTAFYETIISIIFFIFLWKIKNKINISGVLFCIYLILNGIERFMIEKIRINNEYDIFNGITQAEIISFFLIITGLLGSYLLIKKSKKYT